MYKLSDVISRIETANPGAVTVVVGDFNHSNLRKTQPKFYQHVTCSTRGDKILDHCYSSIKNAYKSLKRPPFGDSDHNCIHLVPTYKSKLKSEKPVKRTVRQWTRTASDRLRGCFDCTNWDVFLETSESLDECTEVVTDYVTFCEELCIPTKEVTMYPNQKPWFGSTLRQKLTARDTAFRSGDASAFKAAKYDLRSAVKSAKRDYTRRLEHTLESTNRRDLWRGVKKIADYKPKSKKPLPDDPGLPDQLNTFYSRFEKPMPRPDLSEWAAVPSHFRITTSDTRKEFKRLNARKATGPDNVSTRLLKSCADQLAGIYTELFNWSLRVCKVPAIFKYSIIVPVPKCSPISSLNDYRPVAITSNVMKSFERLVKRFLLSSLPRSMDPFQFAYKANRSVDDAVSLVIETVLHHLDKKKPTYCRLLFVDFSSAFNTILPAKLLPKLLDLGLPLDICNWIYDFLLDRPQVVRVGQLTSSELILSTGAPQGCCLSPLLYSLMTSDCAAFHSDCSIYKFADDTTVAGLIGTSESDYRHQVDDLVMWCSENNLELNVSKTKEVIVDFRKNKPSHEPLFINGKEVEVVDVFKFLGIRVASDLTWSAHVTHCVTKAQQRMFFLRRLRSFGVGQRIMTKFYRAVIESVLTLSITVWYGRASADDRRLLNRVVKTASRIIGVDMPPLNDIYESRTLKRARSIISDDTHPAHPLVELLPSGKRYRTLKTNSVRHRDSFFPCAIRLLNEN